MKQQIFQARERLWDEDNAARQVTLLGYNGSFVRPRPLQMDSWALLTETPGYSRYEADHMNRSHDRVGGPISTSTSARRAAYDSWKAYERRTGAGSQDNGTPGSKPVFPLARDDINGAIDWEWVAIHAVCERLEVEARVHRRWNMQRHIKAVREIAGLLTGELKVPNFGRAVGAPLLSLEEWLSQDPVTAAEPSWADVQNDRLVEASCRLQAHIWAANADHLASLAIRRNRLRRGLGLCHRRLQRLNESEQTTPQPRLGTFAENPQVPRSMQKGW